MRRVLRIILMFAVIAAVLAAPSSASARWRLVSGIVVDDESLLVCSDGIRVTVGFIVSDSFTPEQLAGFEETRTVRFIATSPPAGSGESNPPPETIVADQMITLEKDPFRFASGFAPPGIKDLMAVYYGHFVIPFAEPLPIGTTVGFSFVESPSSPASVETVRVVGCDQFQNPVDNPSATDLSFNTAAAGSTIPVRFSVGGDFGTDVFAAGYPQSIPVSCDTGEVDLQAEPEPIVTESLKFSHRDGVYQFRWKTDKAWEGTCRRLTIVTASAVPFEDAIFSAFFDFSRQ